VEAWRTGQNVETSWKNVAADGNPFYAPLWVLGIAQRYRLFDWIDDVNYTARYVILDGGARITGREALQRLFPETARGAALQAYVNDIRWVIIPSRWSYAMKQSLLERIARRYCQTYAPRSTVDVFATVEQITGNNLQLNQGQQRRLMQFECTAAGPRMRSPQRSAEAGT
jgi:hypothetical protein